MLDELERGSLTHGMKSLYFGLETINMTASEGVVLSPKGSCKFDEHGKAVEVTKGWALLTHTVFNTISKSCRTSRADLEGPSTKRISDVLTRRLFLFVFGLNELFLFEFSDYFFLII